MTKRIVTFGKLKNYATPADPIPNIGEVKFVSPVYDVYKFGVDNLFPQSLAEINRLSPVHRGILNSKSRYMAGSDIIADEPNLIKFIEACNTEQSLHEFHKLIEFDYNSFGNAFFIIVTNSKKSFVQFKYRDAITGRVKRKDKNTKDIDAIVFHPDWANYQSSKEYAETFPIFPNFKKDGQFYYSAYHVKRFENGFWFNGIPSWISGLKQASIGHKTDKWNLSRLDNNMNLSGVLTVEDDVASIEEAVALKDDIIKEFTNEGNTGKMFVIVKEPGGESKTTWTPIQQNNDGDWNTLKTSVSDELVIAHEWRRSLAGIHDNTGFDTDRILTDYEDVLNNLIIPSQGSWLKVYSRILQWFGYNTETLQFVNNRPVSKSRPVLSGDQISKLIEIKTAVTNKVLTVENAIQILQSCYNFSETEANNILL